ncbi:MAG: hypothetical protein RL139_810 [Gemmatimonadota bacterium]|jgi:uncharacterized membrane protein (UPF0182 family)
MWGRRGLLAWVAGIAGILLIGRVVSTWLAERWYADALGVVGAFDARVRMEAWLRAGTAATGFLFALANLLAVRHSIVSMVLPRQLGDLAIGEVVPAGVLTAIAIALAAVLALGFAGLTPDTVAVQLAWDGVRFGVEDPYLFHDVGFYVAWLPFERWLFGTAALIVGAVAALTVSLYLATPSVRREDGRWHVSGWVRRHMALLSGAGLLLWSWSWRLDGLAQVGAGDGAFGAVAHLLVLPAHRAMVGLGAACSALVALALWRGRVRLAVVVASLVVFGSPVVDRSLQTLGERQGAPNVREDRDRAYAATRRAFAAWAQDSAVATVAAMAIVAEASSPADQAGAVGGARSTDSARFAPGAGRYAVVSDPTGAIQAPAFDRFDRRLVQAWALRTPALIRAGRTLEAPRLLTRRDPVDRIQNVYPFLTAVGPARLEPGPAGPVWTVDLFVTAADFPLVAAGPAALGVARYARHVGVGVVDAATGAVGIRLSGAPDPVLRAWMAIAPDLFSPARLLPPVLPSSGAGGASPAARDTAAWSALRAAYDTATAASRRSDRRSFEEAWLRLGRLLGRRAP